MENNFQIPEFMKNQGSEEILSRMLKQLPETIGKEENGWVCDLLSPVAIELSRIIQFTLTEAIKNIIPKYSYGNILLNHAENRAIYPKEATNSKAVLTVKGICGTIIPFGFQFSTAATLKDTGIIFTADMEYIIPESGVIEINTTCLNKGTIGNVAAETIILMVKPQKGITSIVNKEPAYGGFEEETEDSIRKRIADFDAMQGLSFVGSPCDYKRWALEVNGVGSVKVISATDDTGLVTLVLTDLNGKPASEKICEDVYNHIMKPDSYYERLAPVNAFLKTVPAQSVKIYISAIVKLEDTYTIDIVQKNFVENLIEYLKTDAAHEQVKYTEIGAVLIHTQGIKDYFNLLVNERMDNIEIDIGSIPITDENSVVFSL